MNNIQLKDRRGKRAKGGKPPQQWTWDDPSWRDARLEMTDRKEVRSTLSNVVLILREHPAWSGVLAYDEFAEAIVTTRAPSWHSIDAPAVVNAGEWTDTDTARLQSWLSRAMGLKIDVKIAEAAIDVAARAHCVHPVRDYLRRLRWDHRKRLDQLVPRYFDGPDTRYTHAVGAKWMISAIARVERPGCQADHALVLETPGRQGQHKSSALRALCPNPEWYSETPIEIGAKDSYEALRGKWIVCLDELDSVRRAEHTKTKTFLTATRDHYRPAYARRARDFARQCVFAGTTDQGEYLTDFANRRYWPVAAGRVNVKATERDRDQLWAEAYARYKAGETWWPDANLEALCRAEQADRVAPDDWQGPLEAWCRANDTGEGVFTIDVLVGALDFTRDRIGRANTMRVADVLRAIGYERGERVREGGNVEGREGQRQVRRYVLADPKARKQQAWHYAKAQREKADAKGPVLRPPGPPRSGVRTVGQGGPSKVFTRSEVVSVVSGSKKQGGS